MGVKINRRTINELALQGFGGYAHLITSRCLINLGWVDETQQHHTNKNIIVTKTTKFIYFSKNRVS